MNRLILGLLLLALLSGCVTPGPRWEAPLVGTLEVLGPAVYVNKAHGFQGQRIYSGDQVSTGRDSSAIIRLQGGGFWHLDADTDPRFELVRKGVKWFLKVIHGIGQSLVETGEREVEVKSEHGLFSQFGTRFNLRVIPRETALTVLKGRMELVQPQRQPVAQAMQLRISHQRLESLRTLTPGELKETIRWHFELMEQGGWCCIEGELGWQDWRSCLRRRGEFARDRKRLEGRCFTGQRGWCCSHGEVQQLTPRKCEARGGELHGSATQAREACQSPPEDPPGWCCHDGKVFRSNRNRCLGMQGLIFADDNREGAELACRWRQQEDPPGWCCHDGKVFRSNRNRCLGMQGLIFADDNREGAELACRWRQQEDPPGWCCHDGKVFRTNRNRCLGMQGLIFADNNRRGAEAACYRPPEDPLGWCCLDGKVFRSKRNRCLEMQGLIFALGNHQGAEKACRVGSPPPPPQPRSPQLHKIPQAVPTAPRALQ